MRSVTPTAQGVLPPFTAPAAWIDLLLDAAEADTSVGLPQGVKVPDPLIVSWQGREVRIRHDDAHLGPHTPRGAVIRSATELVSDVDGLRLVLASTLGATAAASE